MERQNYKKLLMKHLRIPDSTLRTTNIDNSHSFRKTPNFLAPQEKKVANISMLSIVKTHGFTAGPVFHEVSKDEQPNHTPVAIKSKLDQIRRWNIPEQSNQFKSCIETKRELIYPPANEKIITNNVVNIREQELNEKLNNLDVFQNDRNSITQRIKSLISPFVPSSFFKWKFFIPFRHEDYKISDEAKVEVDEFDLLSPDMERELSNILNSSNQLLVTGFSMNVYTNDLYTLCGQNWLNDVVSEAFFSGHTLQSHHFSFQVIEFYLNLIVLRAQNEQNPSSVYAFSTFFFTRLFKGSTLGRWANKLNFFSYDLLLVPIHHCSHWRLAVINFNFYHFCFFLTLYHFQVINMKTKSIEYYDSLGFAFPQCIDLLVRFLEAESIAKQKTELNLSEWKLVYKIPNIPQQENSFDCGVFACKYADYVARGRPISFTQVSHCQLSLPKPNRLFFLFSQKHIPYFRKCMMYEIIKKKLLT